MSALAEEAPGLPLRDGHCLPLCTAFTTGAAFMQTRLVENLYVFCALLFCDKNSQVIEDCFSCLSLQYLP